MPHFMFRLMHGPFGWIRFLARLVLSAMNCENDEEDQYDRVISSKPSDRNLGGRNEADHATYSTLSLRATRGWLIGRNA